MEHLFILRVLVEANDWHTVIQLEGKRVDAVIDEDYVTQATLMEYTHILDVEVGVAGAHAARTEVSSLD